MNRKRLWLFCCLGLLVLIALIYNPWTLSAEKIKPQWGVLPFNLWFGFLAMGLLLLLTILGAWLHPVHQNNEEEL